MIVEGANEIIIESHEAEFEIVTLNTLAVSILSFVLAQL